VRSSLVSPDNDENEDNTHRRNVVCLFVVIGLVDAKTVNPDAGDGKALLHSPKG
jgi:hypothetical protein